MEEHPASSRESFAAWLAAFVPGGALERSVWDVPLTSNEELSSLERVMVLRASAVLVGDLPPGLDLSEMTLEEIRQLALVRAENGEAARVTVPASREGLSSGRVALAPIEPDDVDGLYRAACHPSVGYRWRLRGSTPGPQEFAASLFEGVLAQFAVRTGPITHGAVFGYNAQPAHGYVYAGFQRSMAPPGHVELPSAGEMLEGMALFVDYLFRTWPFRKVYFEMPEYNDALVAGGGLTDWLELEGNLREHLFHDGRHWDHRIYSIRRETWAELAEAWWAVLEGDGVTAPV